MNDMPTSEEVGILAMTIHRAIPSGTSEALTTIALSTCMAVLILRHADDAGHARQMSQDLAEILENIVSAMIKRGWDFTVPRAELH